MDPDVNYIYYVVSIIVLIAISGFFSVAEGAIVSMNDSRIKKLADEGDKKGKILKKITSKPSFFLATVQTGITVCGFFIACLISRFYPNIAGYLANEFEISLSLSYVLVLIVITFLASFFMIVFGKLLPKALASFNPESMALGSAKLFNIFSILLFPLVKLSSLITDLFLKIFGYDSKVDHENVTEEEIRMLVDVGEEKGVIEQSEKAMINNIFEFDDRDISHIMTHRMDVVAVEKNATFDEIISLAMETGYSRLPVFDDEIDNIIGIVYIKDLLQHIKDHDNFNVSKCMRPALFVPESTNCTELLKVFKAQKKQLAVVVDEYGGTYGIVTMEDLLEGIVGDIQDEYDNEELEIQKQEDGSYILDSSLSIDQVEQAIDVSISTEDDDYDTLGAALIHKIGHTPKVEENCAVIIGGVLFEIIESDERHIIKVKATLTNETENDENSNEIISEDKE